MRCIIPLSAAVLLAGCDGSRTIGGGNCFLEWTPTQAMLDENPGLTTLRWIHAESIQLGSVASAMFYQEGEGPPELLMETATTQAGPMNAALGAGGIIGAAMLFNPDPDQTTVNQEGGGAESSSKSGALAGAHSSSRSSASNRNTNISTNINSNSNKNVNVNKNKNVAVNKSPKPRRRPH